jgi:hypothetical protein
MLLNATRYTNLESGSEKDAKTNDSRIDALSKNTSPKKNRTRNVADMLVDFDGKDQLKFECYKPRDGSGFVTPHD